MNYNRKLEAVVADREGSGGGWRSIAKAFAIAAVLAVPVVLGGYGWLGWTLRGTPLQTTPTPPPTPAAQPTVPLTAAPSGPTRAATPPPTPAPTGVSQGAAQGVVRDWFAALQAGDYQGAESLTAGNATHETRMMTDAIQREAGQRGVQASLAVNRLDLAPATQPAQGQAVRAAFDISVNVKVGPVTVPARQFQGSATYIVQQTAAGLKIADIRDTQGLPTG